MSDRSKETRRGCWILPAILLLVGVLLAGIMYVDNESSLRYTITFRDSRGLEADAPVLLEGREIGRVTRVQRAKDDSDRVAVEVKIFGEYKKLIHEAPDTSARIRSTARHGTHVEVLNRGVAGDGLARGTEVHGLDTWTEERLWKGSRTLAESLETLRVDTAERLERLANDVRSGPLADEVEEFLESLEVAATQSGETLRSSLSTLAERGNALAEKFNRENAEQASRDIRDSVRSLLRRPGAVDDDTREELEQKLDEPEAGIEAEAQPETEAEPD